MYELKWTCGGKHHTTCRGKTTCVTVILKKAGCGQFAVTTVIFAVRVDGFREHVKQWSYRTPLQWFAIPICKIWRS